MVHAAVADGGIQLLGVVLAQAAAAAADEVIQLVVRDEDHLAAQLAGQRIAALLDVLFPAHLLEPVADLALGLAGAHDLEPVAAGALVRRAEDDLDDLAGGDDVVDGDDAVVHLAAHHAVADGRVDGIGKVDAGGTGRQVDDIALRGEGEDLLRQQVALQVVQQVAGILADALVFQQLAAPRPDARPACRGRPAPLCTSSGPRRRTRPVQSILRVRIWTSKGMPSCPMTVVCRLW